MTDQNAAGGLESLTQVDHSAQLMQGVLASTWLHCSPARAKNAVMQKGRWSM